MTVGAVGALCIYDYYMGIPYKTDNNVLKGLDWLGVTHQQAMLG